MVTNKDYWTRHRFLCGVWIHCTNLMAKHEPPLPSIGLGSNGGSFPWQSLRPQWAMGNSHLKNSYRLHVQLTVVFRRRHCCYLMQKLTVFSVQVAVNWWRSWQWLCYYFRRCIRKTHSLNGVHRLTSIWLKLEELVITAVTTPWQSHHDCDRTCMKNNVASVSSRKYIICITVEFISFIKWALKAMPSLITVFLLQTDLAIHVE